MALDVLETLKNALARVQTVEGDIDGYLNDEWDGNPDGWEAMDDALEQVILELRTVIRQMESNPITNS